MGESGLRVAAYVLPMDSYTLDALPLCIVPIVFSPDPESVNLSETLSGFGSECQASRPMLG